MPSAPVHDAEPAAGRVPREVRRADHALGAARGTGRSPPPPDVVAQRDHVGAGGEELARRASASAPRRRRRSRRSRRRSRRRAPRAAPGRRCLDRAAARRAEDVGDEEDPQGIEQRRRGVHVDRHVVARVLRVAGERLLLDLGEVERPCRSSTGRGDASPTLSAGSARSCVIETTERRRGEPAGCRSARPSLRPLTTYGVSPTTSRRPASRRPSRPRRRRRARCSRGWPRPGSSNAARGLRLRRRRGGTCA